MEPFFTIQYAKRIRKLRDQEIELEVNLAKVIAGARVRASAEEVR